MISPRRSAFGFFYQRGRFGATNPTPASHDHANDQIPRFGGLRVCQASCVRSRPASDAIARRFYQLHPPSTSAIKQARKKPSKMIGVGRKFQPVEIEGVENVEFYRGGGFYPGSIGSVLGDSGLRLEHKLGAGGFGTVWLAQNTRPAVKSSDSSPPELVAVKLLTGDASKTESNEAHILRLLKRSTNAVDSGQSKRVVELIDEFTVASPNGTHRCLVLGVSGPSALSLFSSLPNRALEPSVARRAAHQTAQAVTWLHQSGIVHGGR
jgi:hypothetical protein